MCADDRVHKQSNLLTSNPEPIYFHTMETTIAGTKVDTSAVRSVAGQWAGKVTITMDDGAVVTANIKNFGEDVELHDIEGQDEVACEAVELYRDVYEAELTKYLGRA